MQMKRTANKLDTTTNTTKKTKKYKRAIQLINKYIVMQIVCVSLVALVFRSTVISVYTRCASSRGQSRSSRSLCRRFLVPPGILVNACTSAASTRQVMRSISLIVHHNERWVMNRNVLT